MRGTALCPHSAHPCPPQGHWCVGDMAQCAGVELFQGSASPCWGAPQAPYTPETPLVVIQGGETFPNQTGTNLKRSNPQNPPSTNLGRSKPREIPPSPLGADLRESQLPCCVPVPHTHLSLPVFRSEELVSAAAGADSSALRPQELHRCPQGEEGSSPGWGTWWHPQPSPPEHQAGAGGSWWQ